MWVVFLKLFSGQVLRPADTDDLELLLVALGHADDHVVDQGAGGAPVGAGLAAVLVALGGPDGALAARVC